MISEIEAINLVSRLVVNQSGWNDSAVDGTVSMIIEKWSDARSGIEAVEGVVNSWERQGRPPWAVLAAAYRNAERRKMMETPALPSGSSNLYVSVTEGRKIAARKYVESCRQRDPLTDVHILSKHRSNEPDPTRLDDILGFKQEEES